MRDIEVRGLDDLARLSRAMRAAGDQRKGLRRELSSSLNRETKQTRAQMRKGIVPGLPKSGGLASDVLKSTRFTTSTRPTGGSAGVSIRVRSKRSIKRMNNGGYVRHPVFAVKVWNIATHKPRAMVWVTQRAGIHRGFLDAPFQRSRPALQAAVIRAVARIRDQIYRSI